MKKVKKKGKAFFIQNMANDIAAPSSGVSPEAVNSFYEGVEKDFNIAPHYSLQDLVPFSGAERVTLLYKVLYQS